MTLLLDIKLALAEGVPELDGLVTGAANDLPVVGTEGNAEDVGSVANEAASGLAGVQVPKTKSVVP